MAEGGDLATTVEVFSDHSTDPVEMRIRIFVGHGRWLSLSTQAAAELVVGLNACLATCWGNRPIAQAIHARIDLSRKAEAA